MKRIIWAIVALLGLAASADFVTALDCKGKGLTFTTGGYDEDGSAITSANWFEQRTMVKVGQSALRSGPVWDYQESWIQTKAPSNGTLSFWWDVSCVSWDDWLAVYVGADEELYKGICENNDPGWQQVSIPLKKGEVVRWKYHKSYWEDWEGEGCGWLDGVTFTPAPSSMKISFVTNGGNAIAPMVVSPGKKYGELPVPERDGNFEFGGWYLDEGLTERAKKSARVAFRNHTLYAKWRIPVSVIDTDDLQFNSDEFEWWENSVPWEAVAEPGATSGYAVKGPIDSEASEGIGGDLEVVLSGSGTLTFKWKVDGPGGNSWGRDFECCMYGDSDIDDLDLLSLPSIEFGVWKEASVAICSEGETYVRWYSQGSKAALFLSDFSWTPAPQKMRITFATNGGNAIAATNVTPGVTYGDLPRPTKAGGAVFGGWFLDEELTQAARDWDLVQFRDHTLYAKWRLPVSLMDAANMTFSTDYAEYADDAVWEAVEGAGATGGYAAQGPIGGDSAGLNIALPSAGKLAFKWKVDGPGGDSWGEDFDCWISGVIDGWYDCPNNTEYVDFGVWQESEVTVTQAGTASWYSQGSKAALYLSDFVWTPAPTQMKITFETNGGNAIAPTNVAPGVTYGELPEPERDGDFEFGGWYLDAELTERVVDYNYVAWNNHTLYAKWRIPVDVLDTDDLWFWANYDPYSSGSEPWEAVADAEANGGYALHGPMAEDQSLYGDVRVGLPGPGTLSFKWKTDGSGGFGSFWVYSGDASESLGFSSEWQERSVAYYGGEDDGEIYWESCGYGTALMLKDFVWTPAPDALTVTFDANGGTVASATSEFVPGDTFGKLPVPTRRGWVFLGWCIGSAEGKKVYESDWVPLNENTVLVARWGQNLTTAIFNTKTFTNLKQTGTDKWYMVDVPDLGKAAEVESKGKVVKRCSTDICGGTWCEEECEPTVSTLQTTTTVAGYLAFRWSLANGSKVDRGNNYPFVSIALYLDGTEVESDSLWRPGASLDEKQVYVYVPAGKHTLKWEAKGNRSYCKYETEGGEYYDDELEDYVEVEGEVVEEFGSLPVTRVWGFEFVPAGKQPDLQTWGQKIKTYKSWRTGDLARFAAEYKTRMIADPNDYEARILFAATRLGTLAENAQFVSYAKTFGVTVDWARMSVTPPMPKFDKKSAAMNAMVDKTIALATPAIQEAKDALAGIPETWTGTVTLDADEWPLDETIAIDCADVLFARAGLDAALAGLNFLGAYDLTANWPKVNETVNLVTKIPVLKALPKIGDTNTWAKSAKNLRAIAWDLTSEEPLPDDADENAEPQYACGKGSAALAISGNKLALRVAYPSPYAEGWQLDETNQVRDLDFYIRSGDAKLNVYAKVYGENGEWGPYGSYVSPCGDPGYYYSSCSYIPYGRVINGLPYHTKTNVTCWVTDWTTDNEWEVPATIAIRDDELVLNVDMAKVNLGTKKKPVGFAKKSWTVDKGEVGIGSWEQVPNPEWEKPHFDEDGYWVEPEEDLPESFSEWTDKGLIEWQAQSDSERKALKFVNDQKATMFSKVRDATRLSASHRQFKVALQLALAADGKAQARPEDGDLHFFEYDPEDAAKITFARNNTQRALAALDAPTPVNFKRVAEEYDAMGMDTNKLMLSSFDYTLLPDNGNTRIYLGALFKGKITTAMLPPMRTNIYGETVPDFDAMPDPTIGGLIPDMTYDHIAALSGRFEFIDERELDHGEWIEPEFKPGEKVTRTYEDYKGYTASGLPKGWTWNTRTGVLTGTAASTFTVTFAKRGMPSVTETITVGARPAVLLFSDKEAAVAVTGTGLYNVGATVKAVAAVKNGYAFGGWYDENDVLVSPLAVYSFKMTREDVSLIATTIPLESDRLYAKPPMEPYRLALNVELDSYLSPFQTRSVSPFSVSVSGLPPGLTASNVVEASDEEFSGDMHVTGTPTKAGVYYTTFVAKNNGGFKWTAVVKFIVGDAVENLVNTANIDLSPLDMQQPTAGSEFSLTPAPEVPPSANGSAPKSIKVKGLPAGMKVVLSNGALQFSGAPAAAGKYTLDITVTYANKKTARTVKTFIVNDSGSVYIPTGVIDNDPNGAVRGTVPYMGVKQYGQTVKFTATTKDKKKWFFGGWFLDTNCWYTAGEAFPGVDWQLATVSAQIGDYWSFGDGMYARFVTKEQEAEHGVAINCDDFWRVKDNEGLETELPIQTVSDTKATLTASGLPAGTKLSGLRLVVFKAAALVPGEYTATLTLKTAAGNVVKKQVTVFVPNITAALDEGVLSAPDFFSSDTGYERTNTFMKAGLRKSFTLDELGITVSNGWTLAVTGLPKGWTYNASTKTISGVATKAGKTFVTFTVTKKVGRNTFSHKATTIFDLESLPEWVAGAFVGMLGNDYVRMDVAANGTISGYLFNAAGKKTFTATGFEEGEVLSTTLSGKGVKLNVQVQPLENLDVLQGEATIATVDGSVSCHAYNSPWGLDGANPLPEFAAGASKDFAMDNGTLTMKFGEKGVVTCVYTVGRNATTGSTQICELWWDPGDSIWEADVSVALPVKKDGKGRVLVPALVKSILLHIPADGAGNPDIANAWAEY